ncbi:Alstrom syndrome protein 1 isoform X2 [Calypte anna]|uniref:Alstrom syndrome protein 1 isoform X2 n=1 Tax=Calypte anna TaxID=9244 RepID=UPI0011C36E5F|nr:Alstrom syndrome protein 1 isoform X2 [Calypte anna]
MEPGDEEEEAEGNQRVPGTESWYQLPAEVDASCLAAASVTKLSLTCDRNDLTEFPTLEEGALPSAEASQRQYPGGAAHGLLLDIQDSQCSPCFPLLMYSTPGQRLSDETLLQHSEMDFIPLRGVPDASAASEEPSKPSPSHEFVSWTDGESPSGAPSDFCTLSQHPFSFRDVEPFGASCSDCSSQPTSSSGQQLVNQEAVGGCENDTKEKALIPQASHSLANATSEGLLSKANSLKQVEAALTTQTCGMPVTDDSFSCDNQVPAALFELSEEEKRFLRHEEFSSSENSSCKTALSKNSEKREREVEKGKVKMAESESEEGMGQLEKVEKEKEVPDLNLFNNFPDDLRKYSCKISEAQDLFSAKDSETGEGMSGGCGVSFSGSKCLKSVAEELLGAFFDGDQKQVRFSPAVRFGKEEFIPTVASDCAAEQPVVTDREAPSPCGVDAPVEAEPGASRSELTSSDFSIERGHKVTGISPSFNLVGDGSFSVHLAHPSYQSTPGIVLRRNVKAGELGVPVLKADTQASPSCPNEEASENSASTPLSEGQRSLQAAQKEHSQLFESLKWKYPHSGRIQSLPSLNFMEKVGAWDVSQAEDASEAVTSCDPGGVSPRRKAWSAIASSSNNILSIQRSGRDPKDCVAASSRGTGSLGSWCFHNKNFLLVHSPLARSQSDNTVNVSSRKMEVTPPANSAEAAQSLEGQSHVLEVSENSLGGSKSQKCSAEIVSGPSGREKQSNFRGQSSDPNVFLSGEAVAQLLKEDGNSSADDQKNCDALGKESHNLNMPSDLISRDNFGDISPDSLNFLVTPGESSQRGLGSAGCPSGVSRHIFSSGKDDDFIPVGATSLETPVKEELNIEERIPIYLHNLGIDQSPGTILMPFAPRGPIREVEFSPSELRTLKDSTDTLTRTAPQPQGKFPSALQITPTNYNPSTSALNMSLPTSSELGFGLLSLCELSPHFSRSSGDKPTSQCSVLCHQLEGASPCAPQEESECSAISRGAEPNQQQPSPDCLSDRESPMLLAKHLEELLAKSEPQEVRSSPLSWPAGSSAGGKREMEVDRGSQTSSVGSKRTKGQESDSLVGSGALQEIHKLLAEAEDIAGRSCDPVVSTASARKMGETSPGLTKKKDGTEGFRLVKDRSPQFQKMLSWVETLTQRSMEEEESLAKPLNYKTGTLKWENPFEANLHNHGEIVKEMTKEFRTEKSAGRSEPEGCSSVTTDRNQPGVVGLAQSNGSSEGSAGRTSELGNPSSSATLGSVTSAAGDFQSMLAKAGGAGSKAGGTGGSEDSSSGDSLAAHVRNLLRSGSRARETLKSGEGEQRTAQAWMKLRLGSQSQESVTSLNEEHHQRIEEIKAELLLSAKKSALAKDSWGCSLGAAFGYSHKEGLNTNPLEASCDNRFPADRQTPAVRSKELSESSLNQAVPFYRADPAECCLLKDVGSQSWSTHQALPCSPHQTIPSAHPDAGEPHPSLQKEWDMCVTSSAAASDAQVLFPPEKQLSVEKSPENVTKHITSITFASQKRLQSPLTSLLLGSSLTRGGLDGVMPWEVGSAGTEEQSHGKQPWERSKTSPPPSPMLAGSVSSQIAFTAEEDRFHHVSTDSNRAGAHQEAACLSDQDSPSIHADGSHPLPAQAPHVLPQDVSALGRHSARLLGLDCATRFNPETNRLSEPHSVSSSQQEKSSSPGHIQVCQSLEGSGPTTQSDLLKGHMKLLEEKQKSPSAEVPLLQKEAGREQSCTSHHAAVAEGLPTTSPSPSPAKKVLSCVHITLSSKCSNSELQRGLVTEKEMRSWEKPEVNTQPVSLKTAETLLGAASDFAHLGPEDPRSSSFPPTVSAADPCLVLPSAPGTAGQGLPLQSWQSPQTPLLGSGASNLKDISISLVPAKTGKSTSDAATQITTESPEKTTFSAEICIHSEGGGNAVHQAPLQRAPELPNNPASLNRIPPFPRQGDQPLLLPYRPSGSTGMYYVPYSRARPQMSPGSNEALPPSAPAKVLGLNQNPPDSATLKQKAGIYSKRTKPKLAWAEEQMGASSEHTDHSKAVKTTHPVFRSAQLHLPHPEPIPQSSFLSNTELPEDSCGVAQTGTSPGAVLQKQRKAQPQQLGFSPGHKPGGDNEFFPLTAEADHSRNEDLDVSTALGDKTSGREPQGRREAGQKAGRSYPLPHLDESVEKELPPRQRTHSSGSLDELWIKFLECQKRHQHHHSRSELTLVERLERLARLLQSPMKQTLIAPKPGKNVCEKDLKGREEKKRRQAEKSMFRSTLEPDAACVGDRPHVTHDKNRFVELRKHRSGEKLLCHMNRIVEHQQYLETPSDTSSGSRLSRDPSTTIASTTSESDVVTLTEVETAAQTEVSSSISTIDTARLIRAFGHERVEVSPRLSQLYCAINHQKRHSEKWDKGSGKAEGVKYPKVAPERHEKRKEIQEATSLSLDSTSSSSSSSSSWGPSPALTHKRRTRMLSKGIQAGHLEIVSSATKKNTRDVGVTFPTPSPCQPNQRPQEPWCCVDGIFGGSDGVVTDHQAAGSKEKQKGQPGNFFVEKRAKRSRLHLPRGISWFVQAEGLKSESRKENHSSPFPGPGPSWFEPLPNTKSWREPLREKNWEEEQQRNRAQPGLPGRAAEERSSRPLGKLTLQEALAVHRPDFISRSGERVKHLKLVMEERRLQSELQAEREELFNPLEKRKGYRNASHMLSDRGFLIREKRRTIPRSEMVQRSKRIYEQLPEVQKKREEEKRKMEYNSYRLKAQLYKMKITNHVLGRKVPWN